MKVKVLIYLWAGKGEKDIEKGDRERSVYNMFAAHLSFWETGDRGEMQN